jgi:hypothetical protein
MDGTKRFLDCSVNSIERVRAIKSFVELSLVHIAAMASEQDCRATLVKTA